MSDLCQVFKGRSYSGGGFRVHHGQDLGGLASNRVRNRCGIHSASPLCIHPDEPSAEPVDDVAHSGAKNTVNADHHLVSRLHEVDEAGFHTCASRAGNGNGQFILGLEEKSEQALCFIHHR